MVPSAVARTWCKGSSRTHGILHLTEIPGPVGWLVTIIRTALLSLVISTIAVVGVQAGSPGREFTAQATMTTSQGTSHMPITLIVARYTSVEDAQRYQDLLATGGQSALLSALRGRSDGRLRLGVLEMPLGLVVAEELRRGYRYVFVTTRRIQVEEVNESADSLYYPFGVAVFELDDFGRGDGQVYPQAAISVDPSDGSVVVEEYRGEPGKLSNIKKIR